LDYILHIATLAGIYSIAAVGLNYAVGFTGLVSVNHGAFMGVGAYTLAYLTKIQGWEFSPALLMAGVLAGIVAWLMTFPLLKLRDDAFVLVSFGFAFIANNVFLNWTSVTNGAIGMKGIGGIIFPDWVSNYNVGFFVVVLVVLVASCWMLRTILKSSYGVIIRATRENQKVTQIAGHDTRAYRRSVFVISGMITGVAGAFLASYISAIDPVLFAYHLSVLLLVMVILGGLASLKGAVVGASLMIFLPEILRFVGLPSSILAESQQIIYGLVLIVLMVWRPVGLFGRFRI
jgi:branched-chain amino acid transport system permease protein